VPAPPVIPTTAIETPEPSASAAADAGAPAPEPEPPVSEEPVLWATTEMLGNFIAGDDRSVYWTQLTITPDPAAGGSRGTGGVIFAKNKRSGEVREVWRGDLIPWELVITGGTLVFSYQVSGVKRGQVLAVPTQGGEARTLAAQLDGPAAIAADASTVYFISGARDLSAVPLAGGSVRVLYSSRHLSGRLALDDENVYYIQNGGEVWALAKSGAKPRKLATGTIVNRLLVKSGFVYFADQRAKSVLRVSSAGGAVETLAKETRIPGGIAVDADSVYWATAQPEENAIMRAPKSGGAAVTLARRDFLPKELLVDDHYVYTNRFGEEFGIFRVGKLHVE
jgi:hypothetical protein